MLRDESRAEIYDATSIKYERIVVKFVDSVADVLIQNGDMIRDGDHEWQPLPASNRN